MTDREKIRAEARARAESMGFRRPAAPATDAEPDDQAQLPDVSQTVLYRLLTQGQLTAAQERLARQQFAWASRTAREDVTS